MKNMICVLKQIVSGCVKRSGDGFVTEAVGFALAHNFCRSGIRNTTRLIHGRPNSTNEIFFKSNRSNGYIVDDSCAHRETLPKSGLFGLAVRPFEAQQKSAGDMSRLQFEVETEIRVRVIKDHPGLESFLLRLKPFRFRD